MGVAKTNGKFDDAYMKLRNGKLKLLSRVREMLYTLQEVIEKIFFLFLFFWIMKQEMKAGFYLKDLVSLIEGGPCKKIFLHKDVCNSIGIHTVF